MAFGDMLLRLGLPTAMSAGATALGNIGTRRRSRRNPAGAAASTFGSALVDMLAEQRAKRAAEEEKDKGLTDISQAFSDVFAGMAPERVKRQFEAGLTPGDVATSLREGEAEEGAAEADLLTAMGTSQAQREQRGELGPAAPLPDVRAVQGPDAQRSFYRDFREGHPELQAEPDIRNLTIDQMADARSHIDPLRRPPEFHKTELLKTEPGKLAVFRAEVASHYPGMDPRALDLATAEYKRFLRGEPEGFSLKQVFGPTEEEAGLETETQQLVDIGMSPEAAKALAGGVPKELLQLYGKVPREPKEATEAETKRSERAAYAQTRPDLTEKQPDLMTLWVAGAIPASDIPGFHAAAEPTLTPKQQFDNQIDALKSQAGVVWNAREPYEVNAILAEKGWSKKDLREKDILDAVTLELDSRRESFLSGVEVQVRDMSGDKEGAARISLEERFRRNEVILRQLEGEVARLRGLGTANKLFGE